MSYEYAKKEKNWDKNKVRDEINEGKHWPKK